VRTEGSQSTACNASGPSEPTQLYCSQSESSQSEPSQLSSSQQVCPSIKGVTALSLQPWSHCTPAMIGFLHRFCSKLKSVDAPHARSFGCMNSAEPDVGDAQGSIVGPARKHVNTAPLSLKTAITRLALHSVVLLEGGSQVVGERKLQCTSQHSLQLLQIATSPSC
jgi:hypothetical protein